MDHEAKNRLGSKASRTSAAHDSVEVQRLMALHGGWEPSQTLKYFALGWLLFFDHNARLAIGHVTDDPGGGITGGDNRLQQRVSAIARTGDEKPAGGLRVA
jgi:hypothetical protein